MMLPHGVDQSIAGSDALLRLVELLDHVGIYYLYYWMKYELHLRNYNCVTIILWHKKWVGMGELLNTVFMRGLDGV